MLFSKVFYIKTISSKEDIKNKIVSIIAPLNNSYNGKIFQDNDSKYIFEITRNITYRNSFLPVISGEIIEEKNGISKITMGMYSFVKIFVTLWIFGLIIIGIPLSIMSLSMKNIHGLVPILMIVLFKIIIHFAYTKECELSKSFLIDLLMQK